MDIRVSVVIITYGQEGFIGQAVSSALMQDVDFAYEIVIGEDASTDRTRESRSRVCQKHPDKIRVLLRDAADAQV